MRSSSRVRTWRLRRMVAAVVGLALLMMPGCGRSNVPQTVRVRGKVSYVGQPVKEGTVNLQAKSPQGKLSRPAVGTISPDGSFQLSTFSEGDGALPGEYQVAVISRSGGPTPEDPRKAEVWNVPKKFANPATSGLTATVPADKTVVELNFDLK